MKKSTGQVVRLLRRSTALALALSALWVSIRTADLSGAGQALRALSGDARAAVRLLGSQLHASDPAPDGWTRLVLAQSPLLLSGQAAVSAQLAAARTPLPTPEVPETPPHSAEEEDEDHSEPALTAPPDPDDGVIAQTMVPSASQSYLRTGQVYIANRASRQVDVDALARAELNLTLGDGPQILIVHTHGSEAYTPAGSDLYQESDPYRTTDCSCNVVRVGEEMAQVFRQAGLDVLHDTTLYDYPSYNEAYDRSLAAVEQWLEQYPSIRVVLDVHRDALAAEDGTIYKAVSQEEGEQAAQVMLVVGTDGGGSYHPLWQENLTFAIHLQQQLLDDWQTLARPMVLRSSRFNQHLSVGSLLVEVGTHGNTLAEALTGARLFARSLSTLLTGLDSPTSP